MPKRVVLPRLATIVLIVQDGRLCLCKKLVGEFGAGLLVAPGGKCEHINEDPMHCIIRETIEETGFILRPEPEYTRWIGLFNSFLGGTMWWNVHVFYTEYIAGRWHNDPEMEVHWPSLDALPVQEMSIADRWWIPDVLAAWRRGNYFVCNVYYGNDEQDLEKIEFYEVDGD